MALTDTQVLVDAVAQKARAIHDLLDLYERELPPFTCPRFLEGVKAVVCILTQFHERQLKYCRAAFSAKPQTCDEQLSLHSKYVLEILGNIHANYLPYLDLSRQQSDYLILPSILRGIHALEKNIELILVPQFEYCYGFVGFYDFISTAIKKLEKNLQEPTKTEFLQQIEKSGLAQKSRKWTAFLSYPAAEKDSALNLTVLAHEFAHVADHSKELYKQALPLKLDENSFNDLVDTLWNTPIRVGPLYTREDLETRVVANCTSVAQTWLRELIADHIAVHTIGPAYLFAFSDFIARAALKNQPDADHDAPSFRLKLMLTELQYLGYFETEDPVTTLLQRVKEEVEQENPEYDRHQLVIHRTIVNNLQNIQAKLREFVASYSVSYGSSDYAQEVPLIVERLVKGITPSEFYDMGEKGYKPSSVAGILNAGWLLYKTRFPDFHSLFDMGLSTYDVLTNLNQLMFHGVESSEVARIWRNATT